MKSLVLFVSMLFLSNAHADSYKMDIRTTPFYGVSLTLNDSEPKVYSPSSKIENFKFEIDPNEVKEKNHLMICFDHSSIGSSRPNVHNLARVFMHSARKLVTNSRPIPFYNVVAPAAFRPGSRDCSHVYFSPDSRISEAQYNTVIKPEVIVVNHNPPQPGAGNVNSSPNPKVLNVTNFGAPAGHSNFGTPPPPVLAPNQQALENAQKESADRSPAQVTDAVNPVVEVPTPKGVEGNGTSASPAPSASVAPTNVAPAANVAPTNTAPPANTAPPTHTGVVETH